MLDLFLKPQKILETLAAYQELYKKLYVNNEYAAYVIILILLLLALYMFIMLVMKIHYDGLNAKRQYEISGYELQERKKKAEKLAKKKSKKKKGKKRRR